jgi:CheY-like chemotaxis protein
LNRTVGDEARRSVLVVEDEAIIRLDLVTALTAHGFDVVEAGDAATGLELFRANQQINAVVSDLALPGSMSGYQLVQAVRLERPNCTIIIATGKELRIPEDFDEHVLLEQKPYDAAKIALMLRMGNADHI